MVVNIIIAILLFVVGFLMYSIGMLQILIVLFCGFRMTSKLKRRFPGKISSNAIYSKYAFTIVFWSIIIAAVTFAVFHWGNDYAKIGYIVGAGFSFILSIGKWGCNADNVEDYFESNISFIAKDVYDELFSSQNS